MRLCLAAMLAASVLSACASSPDDPVVITNLIKPELPTEARKPCTPPSRLPAEGGLTEGQVVTLWGADRLSLKTCEARRAAIVDAVDAAPESTGADHGD